MLGFLKNRMYPIGVDVDDNGLKMAQLRYRNNALYLFAGDNENRPEDIQPGSTEWQRWAIRTVSELKTRGNFYGKDVIASVPPSETFINHIKMPKANNGKIEEAIFSKIQQKLPFEYENAVIRYLPAGDDNIVAIALHRQKISRHLAIYEKANLKINTIAVWPTAIVDTYVTFFGRRKSDIQRTVCLVGIKPDNTNVVICRHNNLLFAHSIPVGTQQLCSRQQDESSRKLVSELAACRRTFSSIYKNVELERLIFLSVSLPGGIDKTIYETIAKNMQLPTQVGDCLMAVKMSDEKFGCLIDRRQQCQFGWAGAFGLSLSSKN